MRRVLTGALTLLLLSAIPAEAKFSAARVCGATDCRTVSSRDGRKLVVMQEPVVIRGPRVSRPGGPAAKPSSLPAEIAGWYRVILCPGSCEAKDARSLLVAPDAGYEYLGAGGWVPLDDRGVRVYRAVTRGLDPFPVSRLLAGNAAGASQAAAETASAEPPSDGIPTWAWVAISAVAIALGALATVWLRRGPRSASG
jgi:hypothetical protein